MISAISPASFLPVFETATIMAASFSCSSLAGAMGKTVLQSTVLGSVAGFIPNMMWSVAKLNSGNDPQISKEFLLNLGEQAVSIGASWLSFRGVGGMVTGAAISSVVAGMAEYYRQDLRGANEDDKFKRALLAGILTSLLEVISIGIYASIPLPKHARDITKEETPLPSRLQRDNPYEYRFDPIDPAKPIAQEVIEQGRERLRLLMGPKTETMMASIASFPKPLQARIYRKIATIDREDNNWNPLIYTLDIKSGKSSTGRRDPTGFPTTIEHNINYLNRLWEWMHNPVHYSTGRTSPIWLRINATPKQAQHFHETFIPQTSGMTPFDFNGKRLHAFNPALEKMQAWVAHASRGYTTETMGHFLAHHPANDSQMIIITDFIPTGSISLSGTYSFYLGSEPQGLIYSEAFQGHLLGNLNDVFGDLDNVTRIFRAAWISEKEFGNQFVIPFHSHPDALLAHWPSGGDLKSPQNNGKICAVWTPLENPRVGVDDGGQLFWYAPKRLPPEGDIRSIPQSQHPLPNYGNRLGQYPQR